MDIPASVWSSCLPRKTQIVLAELIAPLIGIKSHPEYFQDRAATFFIDNVVAVAAVVRGASRASDLSKLGLTFTALVHSVGCAYWVEWVSIASNLADDGSRRRSVETSAQALGIPINRSPFNGAWLTDLLQSTPTEIVSQVVR